MLNKTISCEPGGDVNPPAQVAVLDAAAIARLQSLDPSGRSGIVERVLRTYEGSLNKLLAQFETARTVLDLETIRHIAHTLRSSSAAVGATQLSAQCADVEAMVREGATDALPAALVAMHAECLRARLAVRAMLDGMAPAA